MKLFVFIGHVILYTALHKTYAQEALSFGALASYNFPLETKSFGIKSRIPLSKTFAVSPQIKYSPASFNDFNEISVGVDLHLAILNNVVTKGSRDVLDTKKPLVYLIGGLTYNHWINYTPSKNSNAKKNNILPEAGIGGLIGGNRLRFFLEGKYNVLWGESSAELGFLVYPFNKVVNKRKCIY